MRENIRKVKSINRHDCENIYTDSEGFLWIITFFCNAEIGMSLKAFDMQVRHTKLFKFCQSRRTNWTEVRLTVCIVGTFHVVEDLRILILLEELCRKCNWRH